MRSLSGFKKLIYNDVQDLISDYPYVGEDRILPNTRFAPGVEVEHRSSSFVMIDALYYFTHALNQIPAKMYVITPQMITCCMKANFYHLTQLLMNRLRREWQEGGRRMIPEVFTAPLGKILAEGRLSREMRSIIKEDYMDFYYLYTLGEELGRHGIPLEVARSVYFQTVNSEWGR